MPQIALHKDPEIRVPFGGLINQEKKAIYDSEEYVYEGQGRGTI